MRSAWRRVRALGIRLLLVPLVGVASRLSWPRVQGCGAMIGRLGWRLSRRDRRRALEHLAVAFPGSDRKWREAIARGTFRHLGITAMECLHLMGCDPEVVQGYVEVEGWEHVEAARRASRPILILTGHCGNWELLAAIINLRGLGMSVIARRANDPELDEPILSLRRRFGTETINRSEPGAARRLLSALRGGALGMLIDQDTRVKGTWVPFFGRDAYTPLGAAEIAIKRRAAVIPSFIARRDDGTHQATFQAPLDLPSEAIAATAEMTRTIEEQIREHPEQWVWFHRRWRRRPHPE